HVVHAADDQVLAGQFGEQVGNLRGEWRPVQVAEQVAEPEDRPHRVADHRVEVTCLGAARWGHTVDGGTMAGSPSRLVAADRADATHAATPTPSYVAPHTASPAMLPTAAWMSATRSACPTAYCGSAPPQRLTRASTGSPRTPRAARRSANTASTSSPSGRCRS